MDNPMFHVLIGIWCAVGLILSVVLGSLIGHILTVGWIF